MPGLPVIFTVVRSWSPPLGWLLLVFVWSVRAAELSETEQLYRVGKYRDCAEIARAEVERGVWHEGWPTLLIRCQLTLGQYEQAVATFEQAIQRFRSSLPLRLLGHQVYQHVNDPRRAQAQYDDIVNLVRSNPQRFSSASDRVALGRFFQIQGEDARQILELFFDRARKANPTLADVHVATAELALEKFDYQEAAKAIDEALKLVPDHPDYLLLRARAWEDSDPQQATQAVIDALEINPSHVPSLLFQIDRLVDAERYDEAKELLTQVLEVNLYQPEAWAYHAVIAHLQGHWKGEPQLRQAALETWTRNPAVDHLIGSKLSRHYRFVEGARYQRQALLKNPDFLPAKFQLSQDLLRLGTEDEGWKLAHEVHTRDGYHVVAFNLATLHDELKKYETIENEHFLIRMDAKEAGIYGEQVLDILNEAYGVFREKYGVRLDAPVTVEIFPRQKDFAIRTFGLPGGAGFLGVCFGRVITANSPASQGDHPANWRSVLWHEFCHVITLEKTKNRIPRWLSEGISVYEEQLRDPGWGEYLTPEYRQFMSDGELTPIGQLSGAFLRPKSPTHLQFAYFESALVVRYLVDTYGIDVLRRLLDDLAIGMPVEESLPRYVGSMTQLERQFESYVEQYVKSQGGELDWTQSDEVGGLSPADLLKFLKQKPLNYQAAIRFATMSIAANELDEAERILLPLAEKFPQDRSPQGILMQLAHIYRAKANVAKEQNVLEQLSRHTDRALDVYSRLAELAEQQGNWDGVADQARRYLSVQPLNPRGHELLSKAARHQNQPEELRKALTPLLQMNPIDVAGLHFQIAQAAADSQQSELAKRHVLQALEHAPRYRQAQALLLNLVDQATIPAEIPGGESKPALNNKEGTP